MEFQHRWINNISRFVSIHAWIQEFSSGVRDGGSRSICHIKISEKVFLLLLLFVFSPHFILQKSDGLFQRKLIIFQVSIGGPTIFRGGGVPNLFPGGGGGWGGSNCLFNKDTHITYFFQGVRTPCPPTPLLICACNIWINWML